MDIDCILYDGDEHDTAPTPLSHAFVQFNYPSEMQQVVSLYQLQLNLLNLAEQKKTVQII
jgi:hypothetical protein